MIFTQLSFLLFFVVTLTVYWGIGSNRARKLWLLACSYFFYGNWDYRFLVLIAMSTSVDFFTARALGRATDERKRRLLVAATLCFNFGILGFFKYCGFFVDSAVALLHAVGFEVSRLSLGIVLPVGISFFTFQSMSYTIDVYRRSLEPQKDFFDYALFVSFFPQLVAGPIVRATTFLPQLETARTILPVRRALLLFASGYFKKACIADNIALLIDPVFADPLNYGALDRVMASVFYSVQIYCDFSGYTDMAIAAAALLGFELTKNFDAPYLSRNIREFWQRWHISLSTWLRDYLYVPLGGNRGGNIRAYRNLMLTMLLGGLWHGANWTFLLWGFLHGLALVVHRIATGGVSRRQEAPGSPVFGGLATLFTFAWVAFCFMIFRCPDVGTAWQLTVGATNPASHADLAATGWLIILLLAIVHAWVHRRREALASVSRELPSWAFYPALGAAAAWCIALTPANAAPFIYFQF